MFVELILLVIFGFLALVYSFVYALILSYLFKWLTNIKNKWTSFFLCFFSIFFLIVFFKLNRKTCYTDFQNRYLPVSKGYRIENNEMNMTYYFPNREKENFNNGDKILLSRFNFNDDYIYGELLQKEDKDVFYVEISENEKLNGKYIIHHLATNRLMTFQNEVEFNRYAKQKQLPTTNKLKTFDEIYHQILTENKWMKILFLQY